MLIFLSKFLPLFVYPVGLACVLIALALLLRQKPRWRNALLVLALAVVWLGGNRWVAVSLVRSLEWRYMPLQTGVHAEAIVVLGGATEPADFPRPSVEVNSAGDRVIYAARLYKQGLAPYLLLSGGAIPSLEPRSSTPAQEMADLLELMGVPRSALWLQNDSRNTAEDALYSSRILSEKGIHRILLVTSAQHMPRAVGLFQNQGLEVIPAPTDYTVTQADWVNLIHAPLPTQLINLVPSASNLKATSGAMKEYIGMLFYRLTGIGD
ncbi:MAG: YdcF family protein [Chloroflexi bacterium]|nr:YdcF family protein [Chloroflexota bacterium]